MFPHTMVMEWNLTLPSEMLLTSPHWEHKGEEARSNLSGIAYGSNTGPSVLNVSVQHFIKNIVITVIEWILVIEHKYLEFL